MFNTRFPIPDLETSEVVGCKEAPPFTVCDYYCVLARI